MYQIKAQNGYELQVIGKGNGLTRVANSQGQIVHSGTYNNCVQWLEDRGVYEANGTKFPRA